MYKTVTKIPSLKTSQKNSIISFSLFVIMAMDKMNKIMYEFIFESSTSSLACDWDTTKTLVKSFMFHVDVGCHAKMAIVLVYFLVLHFLTFICLKICCEIVMINPIKTTFQT